MKWSGLPPHWWLNWPQRHARDASEVLRWVNTPGAHADTFRRLIRVGPVGIYAIRYRPGNVETPRERIP